MLGTVHFLRYNIHISDVIYHLMDELSLSFHSHLQELFAIYNKEFFNGELPNVFFKSARLNKAQNQHRKVMTLGCFEPSYIEGETHAIILDEEYISKCIQNMEPFNIKKLHTTIIHEMCHLWHYQTYKKLDNHGKMWESQMNKCGLELVVAGAHKRHPGSNQKVIDGGKFDLFYQELDTELRDVWPQFTLRGGSSDSGQGAGLKSVTRKCPHCNRGYRFTPSMIRNNEFVTCIGKSTHTLHAQMIIFGNPNYPILTTEVFTTEMRNRAKN